MKINSVTYSLVPGMATVNPHLSAYQPHIRLTKHGCVTEYNFNFCIFNRKQFRGGRFSNALPVQIFER